MTADQLETVIARTGHGRYRWLTSDENPDGRRREGYRAVVARLAEGLPIPAEGLAPAPAERIPLPISLEATRRGYNNCPDATPSSCGCTGPHCNRLGVLVQLADCVSCLGLSAPRRS